MRAYQGTETAGCNRPSVDQTKLSAEIVGESAGESKVAANALVAQFEAFGYSLHELSDGSFLACRWDYSRHLESKYEAQRFYRQIGGRV